MPTHDPLEEQFEALLRDRRIAFTRPERDAADPTTLDFLLPALRIYVEVKQFHTPRLANQLANVPADFTVITLTGRDAVASFEALMRELF
jgi:hypothetical protein